MRNGGHVTVERAEGVAGVEVNDDDRAARAGIGDVAGLAVSAEANVIEIRALQGHRLVEQDRLGDLIGGEIDPDQLGAAGQNLFIAGRRWIEHPQGASTVCHDRLHADEIFADRHLVRLGVAPRIPFFVRIGLELSARQQLGDRDRGVVSPARETDEDPAVLGDAYAGHLMAEIRDLGELRIRARELERERGSGCCGAGNGGSDERLLLRATDCPFRSSRIDSITPTSRASSKFLTISSISLNGTVTTGNVSSGDQFTYH